MYYVYVYINPETNRPMYIGKGSGTRVLEHLKLNTCIKNDRFRNKINTLRKKKMMPIIKFLATGIENENDAYLIEETFIKKYGRKGYDIGGILLNVCESARPSNHKGKTYKEIYGDRWEEEIEKRRSAQLKVGGFGPKNHSKETKDLLKITNGGCNNGTYGKERTATWRNNISKANKGKRRKNAQVYIFDYYNNETKIKGTTDACSFCIEKNISWSTLWKNNNKNMGRCKKGKTKGWQLTIEKQD